MKKSLRRVLLLVLALLMSASVLAGCGGKYEGGDTLVYGTDTLSAKFSPFFYTTAYDGDVVGMTQLGLLASDREGKIVMNGVDGEVVPYNGTDYTYHSAADCEIVQNEDGTVVYKFQMRDDLKFSDGTPVTADDAIFYIYVLCDPTYNGSSTFYSLDIEGMDAYRSGMEQLSNIILAAGPEGTSDFFTADEAAAYWTAFNAAGEKFAQSIVDYCVAGYLDDTYAAFLNSDAATISANPGLQTAFGMIMWGYGEFDEAGNFVCNDKSYDLVSTYPTAADYFDAIVANYGYDISDAGINYEKATDSISDLISAELGDAADTYSKAVKTGDSAASISGVKKTGEYSFEVKMTSFDATAIYDMAGITLTPMHYYGDESLYDYDNNSFGFVKGDLSGIRAKTSTPVGAGPYKFVSYENGVVTFVSNENYYLGQPKITNLLFKETSTSDMITGVQTGSFDVVNPNFDNTSVAAIKQYNSNGELDGDVFETYTIDNLGYGYIGICATTVKVGDDKDSDASKNLRKAFATLFSVYRDTVIDSYYGDRAAVIQYPISNCSWAAPKSTDDGYKIAFSTGVDGNPIYTEGMTEAQKYEAALNAAIEYLKAAGYTWDGSKFTAAPEGASLEYELIIPADGIGDHPAYGVVTNASTALESIGIKLSINDPSDSNVLWDSLDAGTCDMWAAAWSATVDPDMYQVYHSSNILGAGGTDSNKYSITDDTLDAKILEARTSADQSYRKALYKECLEIIIDWAVEVPIYQRQNAYVMSSARVNIETVTPDITTYWSWMNDIEQLEMNPVAE